MANGWVHETLDLIVYGRSYRHVHKAKDAPASKMPGRRHRSVNHGWYQGFDVLWSFSDPFPSWFKCIVGSTDEPERAEELMVSHSHDYLDRVWDLDGQAKPERDMTRKYWESFFAWLLLNPETLKEWAGVDVVEGAIQREVDGQIIWEEASDVRGDYRRLRNMVQFLLRKDRQLREMLAKHGEAASADLN